MVFAAGAGFGYWLAPDVPDAASPSSRATRESTIAGAHRTRLIGADESSARPAFQEPSEPTAEELTAALVGAAHRRDFSERRAAAAEIARRLDASGVARAMAAANSLSVADRDWVQPTLVSRWVELEPDKAIAWIRALPQRQQREFLLQAGFSALGLMNPATALRLMTEQEGSGDRDVVRWVFDGWAQHDPQSATVASLSLPEKSDRAAALHAALRKWAVQSPEAALDWLANSPNPEEVSSEVDNVFHLWAEQDPVAAGGWLNTLAPGEQRDEVANTFAKLIAENDPEAAFAWASSIGDPTQRERSVRETLSTWIRKDEPAALAWVRTSQSLSTKLRQELLSKGRWQLGEGR